MFAYFYWDPSPYIFTFTLPFLQRPVLWYGVLFALGFFIGYFIFRALLFAYLCTKPYVSEKDIICAKTIAEILAKGQEDKMHITRFFPAKKISLNKIDISKALSRYLEENEGADKALRSISIKNRFYFFLSESERRLLAKRFYLEKAFGSSLLTLKKKSVLISEKVSFASIVGAVIGARLFDVLFYQDISRIIKDPISIFRIWEGGLASHGGVIGVLLALYMVAVRLNEKRVGLSLLRFLDLASMPAAFAAAMIRLGNFINQEILGIQTAVPWAVIFGHPADHSAKVPRHPVQLYEMIAYLVLFFFLLLRWKKYFRLQKEGKVFALLLMYVFFMRFVLEFFKVEQSDYLVSASLLTMGQILSIPFILAGAFLYFRKQKHLIS